MRLKTAYRLLALVGLVLTPLAGQATPPALFPVSEDLPRIVMGAEGRRLNAAGDRIYAEGLSGRSARHYHLLRPGPVLTGHAGERLGRSTIRLGTARLVSLGEPALLRITRSRREIRPGDFLRAIGTPRSANDD